MTPSAAVIEETGLSFSNDSTPGIYRKGKPGKFHYVNRSGKRISDEKQLARIAALVLPPAWTSVWICPKANGHLQATGIDAAGRKQYRYHPDWTKRRSQHKYFRLTEFGKALPKARERLRKDLARRELDERKVLAICVDLLQKTFLRVGTKTYMKQYKSVGLSTLKDRHVKINGSTMQLSFVGKKGVRQDVKLTDRRLARLVKKCREIPGQELFQYFEKDGERRSVDSGQINDYIKEITGSDFTAKDFRTWGGTLEALRQFALCYKQTDNRSKAKIEVDVLDCVATKLGNTRAVCKSAYVYPLLLDAHRTGSLERWLKKMDTDGSNDDATLHNHEKTLRAFLRYHERLKNQTGR